MSSNVEGIVNCAAYSDGRRIATIPIEDISEHLDEPSGFVWIGLHDPSGAILKQIQDICTPLMRFDLEVTPEDTRPYFRDVYDHVIRINEMVDSTREILATALEANFSLISISENEIQKRFAGWAAILAVPTMIAGIYGMNLKFMPELSWYYGYPVILSGIVILCGLMYSAFKRAGWL